MYLITIKGIKRKHDRNGAEMEEMVMKGFYTGNGYMGLVEGRYILFASENDYYDYMND